jgi:hypothetical protein
VNARNKDTKEEISPNRERTDQTYGYNALASAEAFKTA